MRAVKQKKFTGPSSEGVIFEASILLLAYVIDVLIQSKNIIHTFMFLNFNHFIVINIVSLNS